MQIIVRIEWDQPSDPNWMNADNCAVALNEYCKGTKFKVSNVKNVKAEIIQKKPVNVSTETKELSGSEAIFAFLGWLTSRSEVITFSEKHNAALAADLAEAFCTRQKLKEPG